MKYVILVLGLAACIFAATVSESKTSSESPTTPIKQESQSRGTNKKPPLHAFNFNAEWKPLSHRTRQKRDEVGSQAKRAIPYSLQIKERIENEKKEDRLREKEYGEYAALNDYEREFIIPEEPKKEKPIKILVTVEQAGKSAVYSERKKKYGGLRCPANSFAKREIDSKDVNDRSSEEATTEPPFDDDCGEDEENPATPEAAVINDETTSLNESNKASKTSSAANSVTTALPVSSSTPQTNTEKPIKDLVKQTLLARYRRSEQKTPESVTTKPSSHSNSEQPSIKTEEQDKKEKETVSHDAVKPALSHPGQVQPMHHPSEGTNHGEHKSSGAESGNHQPHEPQDHKATVVESENYKPHEHQDLEPNKEGNHSELGKHNGETNDSNGKEQTTPTVTRQRPLSVADFFSRLHPAFEAGKS